MQGYTCFRAHGQQHLTAGKQGLQSSLGKLSHARFARRPYEQACPFLVYSKPALHTEACSGHQHNMAHPVVQKHSCTQPALCTEG